MLETSACAKSSSSADGGGGGGGGSSAASGVCHLEDMKGLRMVAVSLSLHHQAAGSSEEEEQEDYKSEGAALAKVIEFKQLSNLKLSEIVW